MAKTLDEKVKELTQDILKVADDDEKQWELLCNLDSLMKEIDRINILEYSDFEETKKMFDAFLEISHRKYQEMLKTEHDYKIWLESEEVQKQMAEKGSITVPEHLSDTELDDEGQFLVNDRFREITRNYYSLRPPYVSKRVKIPKHIKKLYAESRWSYVFQNYCSSVALCRAILELAIKDMFGYDKDRSIGSTTKWLEQSYQKKVIPENVFIISKDVILKANAVMHSGRLIKRDQALNVIEKTKEFLEEVYFTRKTMIKKKINGRSNSKAPMGTQRGQQRPYIGT